MASFSWAVCRQGVGSNSILCQFCRCLLYKRCSGIRGKRRSLNVRYVRISRQTAEDCPSTELNGQSLEVVARF